MDPEQTATPDTEATDLTPAPLPETPSEATESDIAAPPQEDAADVVVDDPVEDTLAPRRLPDPAIQIGGPLPVDSAIVIN